MSSGIGSSAAAVCAGPNFKTVGSRMSQAAILDKIFKTCVSALRASRSPSVHQGRIHDLLGSPFVLLLLLLLVVVVAVVVVVVVVVVRRRCCRRRQCHGRRSMNSCRRRSRSRSIDGSASQW